MDTTLLSAVPQLSLVESSKRAAAYRAVDEHYPTSAKVIGIGSGSTVVYVVERIAQLPRDKTDGIVFVPTGYQSRDLIVKAGLKLGSIELLTEPMDVTFDGADEVDPFMNCIKGGGACQFQEKLVAINSRKLVVVADFRKLSPSLSTHYPAIPIEVVPAATSYVLARLTALGSVGPALRLGGSSKAGPCVTDNGNFIIDAPFPDGFISPNTHKATGRPVSPVAVDAGLTVETGPERVAGSSILGKEEGHPGASIGMGVGANENVEELARVLKGIVGVVEHGIFWAGDKKPVMAYFGMEDGTVSVRQHQ